MAKSGRKKMTDMRGIAADDPIGLRVSIGEATGKTVRATDYPSDSNASADERDKATPNLASFISSIVQATLYRESSGRGGRVVTIVRIKPAPGPGITSELAKTMRRGLGCGSHAEGAEVVLQGDIRDRARAWLTKSGIRKVVTGN
ncbi:MAG: translation initiation factor [Synergistaceae bacterium]|jgi:translation initiation factor 1 (eIF-1/SUI1)|nr:translation initiation factor [Synergistaceae bacterium]